MRVHVLVKDLGRTDYETVFRAMQSFTDKRTQETPDEIWLTEHEPVFTQGQAGKEEHLIAPGAAAGPDPKQSRQAAPPRPAGRGPRDTGRPGTADCGSQETSPGPPR